MSFNISHVTNESLNGISETILVDSEKVLKGEFNYHSFEVKEGFRLLVRTNNAGAQWEIHETPRIFPPSAQRLLLKTDGDNIIFGNGGRTAGYTDIIQPMSPRVRIAFRHTNSSDFEELTYSITLVKFPVSSSETTISNAGSLTRARRSGNLDEQSTETLYESYSPSEIEHLEFSSNELLGKIVIYYKNDNGNDVLYGGVTPDGTSTVGFQVKDIIDSSSGIWQINSYEQGAYKFTLNKKLTFPKGLKIELENVGSTPINIAGSVYVRYF